MKKNLQYIFHTHCILEVMQKMASALHKELAKRSALEKNF